MLLRPSRCSPSPPTEVDAGGGAQLTKVGPRGGSDHPGVACSHPAACVGCPAPSWRHSAKRRWNDARSTSELSSCEVARETISRTMASHRLLALSATVTALL